ncbi:MAG: hypothetical protein ABI638_02460 [Ignavibacteriota bacterium]
MGDTNDYLVYQKAAPIYASDQGSSPYSTSGQSIPVQASSGKLVMPYPTISNSTYLALAVDKLRNKVAFRPKVGRKFDFEFWDLYTFNYTDRYDEVLRLKDGISPSKAIEAIFEKPEKWSFDCAEFVQAILLYTLLNTIGSDKFNSLPKKPGGNWLFRQHFSTGLNAVDIKIGWERDENKILRRLPGGVIETKSAEQILKEVPVGTIITFKNYNEAAHPPFENENSIKAGDDLYIAIAIGKELFVSRKEIEVALAEAATGLNAAIIPKDYIKKNILIYDILPIPR